MFTRTAFGKVVDHCAQRLEGAQRISPQVSPMGFLRTWLEQQHWRLVSMHDPVSEDGLAGV